MFGYVGDLSYLDEPLDACLQLVATARSRRDYRFDARRFRLWLIYGFLLRANAAKDILDNGTYSSLYSSYRS